MLGQSSKVGVSTRIEIAWPVGDPPRDIIVVPGPPKIVNEVRHRFPQRNAIRDPIRCSGERHRMPSLRRQEVAQLGITLGLREDPL